MPCQFQRHCFRQAQQLRQLAQRNDHGHSGQVAAHYLVRNELDQPACACETVAYLQQRREQGGQGEQHGDALERELSIGGELSGQGRHHCRSGCARRGDEAAIAADQRCHNAERCRTQDAGERAVLHVAWSDCSKDQHTERDRRRQCNQHRRQAAPQISG
jgi:hypothetical protein